MKLRAHPVEKPWGRTELPPPFEGLGGGRRIGELWFEETEGPPLPLLVKYIFTSEKLSVQVHPDDAQAQARGLPNGKSECWYILAAEAGARLGLGLREPVSEEGLRRAALDGSIEALLDWKLVRPGDFFSVPAGTIHTIGSGISLIEVQQRSDTTYRLYDYGRPRELHLDDAVAVARREPHPPDLARHVGQGAAVLLDDAHFAVAHVTAADLEPSAATDRWILPLEGSVQCAGESAAAGDCILVRTGARALAGGGARMLVATAGAARPAGAAPA